MTDRAPLASARVLRDAFDATFAAPPAADAPPTLDVLAVRVGPGACALRLSEVASLHRDLRIVPVPALVPALLGVAEIRGALIAAYDLAALLGHPSGSSRWLAVTAARRVGLAFEASLGHHRVDARAFVADAAGEGRDHVDGVVDVGGERLALLRLRSIVEAVEQRAATARREG